MNELALWITLALLALCIIVIVIFIPLKLFIKSVFAGARINPLQFIDMRLRGLNQDEVIEDYIRVHEGGLPPAMGAKLETIKMYYSIKDDPTDAVEELITAHKAGIGNKALGNGDTLGLTLDRIMSHGRTGGNIKAVITAMIRAHQAGIIYDEAGKQTLTLDAVLTHDLAKGNLDAVVDALIVAKQSNIHQVDVETVMALDKNGQDVVNVIRGAISPINKQGRPMEVITKNGVKIRFEISVTLKTRLEKILKSVNDDTILLRVEEAIFGAASSLENHRLLFESPREIAEGIRRKLNEEDNATMGFEIMSVDIRNPQFVANIGEQQKAVVAEEQLKAARAEADKRRVDSVAREAEYRADIQKARAELLREEAELAKAIAEAFRSGRMSPDEYYKMQNMQADTSMRRALAREAEVNARTENTHEEDDGFIEIQLNRP